MSLMISELYDALTAAGAPKDKAVEAAEAVAHHERDIAQIKASMLIVKWLLAINLVFLLAIVMKVYL
jgi:hypothetical protein